MGICAHKKDQEDSNDLPCQDLAPKPSAKHYILLKLVDMRKAQKVPLLSLAHNPLYLRRVAEMKGEDSTSEDCSPKSNRRQDLYSNQSLRYLKLRSRGH